MTSDTEIDELLRTPPSPALAPRLRAWAETTRDRILRGDMMIGILSPDEVAKIPQAYRRAAQCGDSSAWIALARWYVRPDLGDPDLDQAESILRQAAKQGVAEARLEWIRLVWFHKREAATHAEQREAYLVAKELAESGSQHATYLLGLLTFHGFGVAASPEQALALQLRAADLGNADAMFELFVYYQQGVGAPKDENKAIAACERAAAAGHPRAMYNLGAMCATGRGLPKNTMKAVEWYERAADAGNPSALVGLAAIYAAGDGVPQDRERAAKLLDEAEYVGIDVSGARDRLGL